MARKILQKDISPKKGDDWDGAGFTAQPIEITDKSPADYLRWVLSSHDAEISEKISAAKALADIERRAGGAQGSGADRLTREELCAEIARIRAEIGHIPLKS
jgi:hypothetical protein